MLALGIVLLHGCASAGMGRGSAPGTRADLRHAIDSMVAMPKFANAHWGILIVDPVRGDTLYSRNAGKLFMPAANQKLFTGAVALALLGPFLWPPKGTSVFVGQLSAAFVWKTDVAEDREQTPTDRTPIRAVVKDVDGDGAIGCADPDCAGACMTCGDGACGPLDTCRLCPADCGACPAVCGDFLCDGPETGASCPSDCP